jgi:diacylglycerol kinase (ATP)
VGRHAGAGGGIFKVAFMNKNSRFSIHSRWKSFQYAIAGILEFFRTEHNAWLHLLAAIGVIIISFVVGVTRTEAIILTMAVALVWITEMLNTCIEKAMDLISEEYHPGIKLIKDISAGAVLIAALSALVTGLIIFIPKFM